MKTTKLLFKFLTIAVAVAVHQVQAQSILTSGLVAYYPFNGNANDVVGTNNGTLNGTDWDFGFDRFGQPSNALFLNTNSIPAWNLNGAYVAIPQVAALDFNSNFTVSVWVNLSANSATMPETVISDGQETNSFGLTIYVNDPNYGVDDILGFGWGVNSATFQLVPLRNAWWQITVVRSGNTASIFKNGSFLTNVVPPPTASDAAIWFGKYPNIGGNGSWYPLIGGLDDIRIYNVAFSSNEVQQLYQYESTPQVGIVQAVTPTFSNLYIGTNYQLQISSNLNGTFTNFGSSFTATNSVMTYPQYFNVANWNQLFFQLQVAP
jgi:Concanavalin A-like lectin/glucanases superfamily